jgi:hypothetical protein
MIIMDRERQYIYYVSEMSTTSVVCTVDWMLMNGCNCVWGLTSHVAWFQSRPTYTDTNYSNTY